MLELVARVQAGRQLLVVGAQGDPHADPWRQGSATQFVIVSRDAKMILDWREYLRRLAPPRVSDVWRALQAGRQLLSTKDVKCCFWHK